MPFRFRRSISLGKGFRINLSKGGISSSFGVRGASLNVGKRGVRSTLGAPGTGLSYSTSLSSPSSKKTSAVDPQMGMIACLTIVISLCLVGICCYGILYFPDLGSSAPTSTSQVEIPIQRIIELTGNAARAQTMLAASPIPTDTLSVAIPIESTPTIFISVLQTNAAQPTAFILETNTPFSLPTQPISSGGNGGSFDSNGDGKITCGDFQTQAAAQRAYNAGNKSLDGNDNDGKACESLP